jgi:hypothetical protein
MNVTFDTESVLEKAWEIGREGSRANRYEYVKALPENPVQLKNHDDRGSVPAGVADPGHRRFL